MRNVDGKTNSCRVSATRTHMRNFDRETSHRRKIGKAMRPVPVIASSAVVLFFSFFFVVVVVVVAFALIGFCSCVHSPISASEVCTSFDIVGDGREDK